jgi:uncharacterized membrane protein (DUF373 family)
MVEGRPWLTDNPDALGGANVTETPPEGDRKALASVAYSALERADRAVYVAVGVLFLAAAVAMVAYSVEVFFRHIDDEFPLRLITFINDLLLVLIILEVLGTVRSYLKDGTTSLAPFLYIGIISATRRILAIGAQTTLGETGSEPFSHFMIDLGVNGAVVLALAVALFLLTRRRIPESG